MLPLVYVMTQAYGYMFRRLEAFITSRAYKQSQIGRMFIDMCILTYYTCIGRVFYLTALINNVPLAGINYKIPICYERHIY
jgi:hypothetical protein